MATKAKNIDFRRQRDDAILRWNRLTPSKLASAIFLTTNGDLTKLATEPWHHFSIWGKLVKELELENTKLDRLWAFSAFHSNAKGVQVSRPPRITNI